MKLHTSIFHVLESILPHPVALMPTVHAVRPLQVHMQMAYSKKIVPAYFPFGHWWDRSIGRLDQSENDAVEDKVKEELFNLLVTR